MRKPRTARAVAGNQGVQREYARRLRAVLRSLLRDALKDLHQELGMAHDADSGYEPSPADITSRFAADMARWMIKAGQAAERISRWFCAAMYRSTTHAQKQALMAAGVSKKSIDMRWNIPVLKRQYISPTAAKALEEHIRENTKLITRMASQDLGRLQGLVQESRGRNVSFSEIEDLLGASQGFDEERAKRVALDQTNKLNQEIQRDNARDLGITKCIWMHVPGQYTQRKTHKAFDGKTFDTKIGLYDSDVGRNVLPCELPYCRCQARMVQPEELFND